MRTRNVVLAIIAAGISSTLLAQNTAPAPKVRTFGKRITVGGEMGKWWRDPEISKKLQLSDGQVAQLDQIFFDHRMKLIDHGAEMEKQDLKLQSLLDADNPNEGEIGSQVDLVLSARGKLEREYTFMNLDLRKVLSLDQWRQLKSIRGERGAGDNVIFFHQKHGGDVIFQKKLRGDGPGAGPTVVPIPPDEVEVSPTPDPTL